MNPQTWNSIADELFFIRQAYNNQKLSEGERITAMKSHCNALAQILNDLER